MPDPTSILEATPTIKFGERSLCFPARGHAAFWSWPDLTEIASEASLPPPSAVGIWGFQAESGVCGVMPVKIEVRVGPCAVVGARVLAHGEKISVGELTGSFREVFWWNVREPKGLSPCAYTRHKFLTGDVVYRCPRCHALYLETAWIELAGKRCCSKNCQFVPPALEVTK